MAPCQYCPVTSRYSAVGPHTSAAPTTGIRESSVITTPHSTAARISRIQKIRPPSAPCAMATSRLPFTVARITPANLRNNRSSR